ncbi:MAG: hypothetical protein K0A89_11765 [ANME-2 cluster archaeon]|nr:hypothetical protein [ANME-2 cluster archaeon]MCL7474844.1 hypothetical protein [ANME-2 cluster archaeon]MDF1532115.1 hypothetical protein [ANME-2 cluster archaeon]MDW7774981.1 hypothetical protein [Methanosarcinales archaeon]
MRLITFFLFVFISISLIFSGCLREYDDIHISSMDVLSVPKDTGTELTITTYIQNDLAKDSSSLSLRVKVQEPSTHLNVAEKEADIGYVKSNSQSHYSISMAVQEPGEYLVEVELLENGNILNTYGEFITVKAMQDTKEPSDIVINDMNLVIRQFVDGISKVVVDVSPSIYNQGGDSEPLTMEVRATVDPYSVYTEVDEIGIIKGSGRVRGDVTFILPKNSEYSFSVHILENGRTVASGIVDEKIRLNEIKFNTPMTYGIVEEGKPPVATATAAPSPIPTKEPGFQGMVALLALLLVVSIMLRKKKS